MGQAQKTPSDSEEDRQFQATIRRERIPGLNLPELDAEHREILEAHFKKVDLLFSNNISVNGSIR